MVSRNEKRTTNLIAVLSSILVICDGLLFLGIMVSHREYVNLYYIIMHGVNNSMLCIDSS
jgi:hypothetical protein